MPDTRSNGRTFQNISDYMSDGKSGVIPDRMSESLPNRMSDRLPNRMPAKCQIEWKNNMSHRMTEYYIYMSHGI